MGKARSAFLFLLLFTLSPSLRADHEEPAVSAQDSAPTKDLCPAWVREKGAAPPCPRGSEVLSDDFPAMAHIVADDFNPHYGNWAPSNIEYWKEIKYKMAVDFVIGALKGADPKVPLFFLPVAPTTLEKIKEAIGKEAGNDEEKKKRWLATLVPLKIEQWVYLQDPMKSVRGSEPGTVEIRPIPSQLSSKKDQQFTGEEFANAAHAACPLIKLGKPIVLPPGEEQGDGHAGGNIVGLPGGLVTRGLNVSNDFARQYSGGIENQVEVNTDWLYIGHADEIVTTIPNPKGEEPCKFSVAIASVRKAMELLKDPAHKDDPFVEGAPGSKVVSQEEENRLRTDFSMWWICNPWQEYQEELRKKANLPDYTSDERKKIYEDCNQLKTGQVAELIEKFPKFAVSYELAQLYLDSTKRTVVKRIEERIPACKGKVKVVEVPMLYQPMRQPIPVPGAKETAPIQDRFRMAKGAVRSWLPNLVNGVSSGNTLVSPHPHNKLFREYMQKTLAETGAANAYADDYYYAHMGSGNVHCATHTMRFCQ